MKSLLIGFGLLGAAMVWRWVCVRAAERGRRQNRRTHRLGRWLKFHGSIE